MIKNIFTPLSEKSRKEVLEEIKNESENGLLLQLIRKYQIDYGSGSFSDNILIPYSKKSDIIIVNNPEDAERLANDHIKKISNLRPYVFDSIISTTDVNHWKEQRRDYQSAFSVPNKLEKIMPISNSRAMECIDTLWNISNKGDNIININEFLLNETHAQLQLAMFGFSKKFEEENNEKIRNMFANSDFEEGKNVVKNLMEEIYKSNGHISEIINERKENKNRREEVGNGLIFSYAGHDTTGNTLTFLIYELCKNKTHQKMLQKEVDKFWLSQDELQMTYKDLKRLPFMTRCIMETLRLWPALANGTFRELTEDDYVIGKNNEKVEVSKGTYVQIPNWFRHRNPELWGEDVNEFNPNREFIDEELWEGTVINSYNPSTPRFSPFTYTPRDCIGKNFSQIEMRIILLHLLQRYDFELADLQEQQDNKYFVYNRFTMGPRNVNNKSKNDSNLGLYVKIKRRNLMCKL